MLFAIVGSTGGTGRQLVTQALNRGFSVRALARRPDALEVSSPSLSLAQADVRDEASLRRAFQGVDAVVSAFSGGSLMAARRARDLLSVGTSAIISAMRSNDVTRLVTISSVGVDNDPDEKFVYRHVIKRILKPSYKDMVRMEQLVQDSDLDYTIVRPPLLVDKSGTGHYRTQPGGNVKKGYRLARSDLATFILHAIEHHQHSRSIVGVAY